MIAAWTTLSANVVVTAVEAASLREQVAGDPQSDRVGAAQPLRSCSLRLQRGDASGLDVAAQQAQLAQARAGLPALVKQLRQTDHALAVLTGGFPDRQPAAPLSLAGLRLPTDLPLSLPSALVAQRPDVRQARANLHAASAAVGIATAERLPNIQLTANAGSSAFAISQDIRLGHRLLGHRRLVDGADLPGRPAAAPGAGRQGGLRGGRAAVPQRRAGGVSERGGYPGGPGGGRAGDAERGGGRARRCAGRLHLSQLQLQRGYIGVFELLAAEQAYQQAQMALVQDEANRFADTAALYQALGWRLVARRRTENETMTRTPLPRARRLTGACLTCRARIARRLLARDARCRAPARRRRTNVTLTRRNRAEIHLLAVAPAHYRTSITTTAVVDFDHDRSIPVLAPFSGPVTRVRVTLGDHVAAGQALAMVELPGLHPRGRRLSQGIDQRQGGR